MAKNNAGTSPAQLGADAVAAVTAVQGTAEQKQPETTTTNTDTENYPHTGDKEPVGLVVGQPPKEGDVEQIGTDVGLNESPAGEVNDPAPAAPSEPAPAPATQDDKPEDKVEQLRLARSSTFASMADDLLRYTENMGRNQVQTSASAAAWQKRLYNAYTNAFMLEGMEFNDAMAMFIEAFKTNPNGCFDGTMLNRAMSHLPLAQPKLRLFSHFNHLFSKAAEIGAKAAGREVDLNAIAKELPTEQGRQFLLAYFR